MKNRISMAGHIKQCWLFVYRVPIEQLKPMLPGPLELVTKGEFGFLNIVVSNLTHMRPALLPIRAGLTYWHVAYRLHVSYNGTEGLYFLRSDADSSLICASGNILTDFKFHRAKVNVSEGRISIEANGADAEAVVLPTDQSRPVPGSPFSTIEEAASFLKYKPAALAVRDGKVGKLGIQRDEAAWQSRLSRVEHAHFEFLTGLDATFELCYEMKPIDYIWNAEVLLS